MLASKVNRNSRNFILFICWKGYQRYRTLYTNERTSSVWWRTCIYIAHHLLPCAVALGSADHREAAQLVKRTCLIIKGSWVRTPPGAVSQGLLTQKPSKNQQKINDFYIRIVDFPLVFDRFLCGDRNMVSAPKKNFEKQTFSKKGLLKKTIKNHRKINDFQVENH